VLRKDFLRYALLFLDFQFCEVFLHEAMDEAVAVADSLQDEAIGAFI
jgi:hypothetical protein